jgi:hypothetical protein
MVAGGSVSGEGAEGQRAAAGRISKRTTKTMKFEWLTFTPIGISVDVASGSDLSPVVSDASGMVPGMTVMNMTNRNVAIIDAISTNTLALVAIGSAGFTCVDTDRLLLLSPAFKEGSSNPETLAKEEDQLFNYVQIVRHAVEIAKTAQNNPHYGSEDYFKRIKRRQFEQARRHIENTLLFSERAVSETTSTSARGAVYTTRGAVKFSANQFDAGGGMTLDKFTREMPLAMPDTVNPSKQMVMLCGRHIAAEMQTWYRDSLVLQGPGEYEKLGLKSSKFMTAGPTIHAIQHNAFDQAGMQNCAFVYDPEDFAYYFKEANDLHIAEDIQSNDSHTKKDELTGTCGFADIAGGANSTFITNWGALGAV